MERNDVMANENDTEKLAKLIKGIRVAMLTTQDDDGTLRSRPMETQSEKEFDGTLWFFTPLASHKVHEVEREHQVNLSYAAPDDNRYVSVSGLASISRDRAKIDELWSPALKAWFPKGKDDPDVALLKVDVSKAEYWDSPSSTLVKLAGFTKAVLTGQRYEAGENKKLNDLAGGHA
jgi:general stress protein 26